MIAAVVLLASLQQQAMRLPVAEAETLAVTTQGAGAPVVLVPGLFGSAFAWRHVAPALADSGYRTIIIEPLGMGASSRPPDANYSLTAQAGRLAATLDSLHARSAILLAHSTSASIALRLALQRPDLVRAVISVDGGPAEEAAMPGFRRIMRYAPLLRLFATRHRIEKMFRDNFIGASGDTTWVTDQVVRAYAAGATADAGRTLGVFRGMVAAREPQRLDGNLGQLRIPVRLLVGGALHNPSVSGPDLARLAAQIRDFAADTVAGAGHYIHEERPAAVIAAVRGLPSALSVK